VTLFGNLDFKKTCSYGPAGLFRLDKYEAREWARISFDRFAMLERQHGPETGIKLLSGHIQSDSRENLEGQVSFMFTCNYFGNLGAEHG
jgi:D-aspartate oxidase